MKKNLFTTPTHSVRVCADGVFRVFRDLGGHSIFIGSVFWVHAGSEPYPEGWATTPDAEFAGKQQPYPCGCATAVAAAAVLIKIDGGVCDLG